MQANQQKTQTWTKPYCGVSHLQGLAQGWQVTATDRGSFAECWIVYIPHGFSSLDHGNFDTLAQAQDWGETTAQAYQATR